MKQATAKLNKKNENKNHIFLIMDNDNSVEELPRDIQSRYFGTRGSIRNLMAIHNSLFDAANAQSDSNKNAVKQAASVLEANIDQKIDAMNEFLDREFDKTWSGREKSKKQGRKTRKKVSKKTAKKALKKRA